MNLINLVYYFIIIIPSAIIHEIAHGAMALHLGDPTARDAGRLTLNPLAHIDVWGTILMPISLFLISGGSFMFAYAKPVPYNPYNIKNKYGELLVAIAGPISNFVLAVIFALSYRFLPFNELAHSFLSILVFANIALAIFNLVPIPPLDGSKILYLFIPKENFALRIFLEKYGWFILLFFLFFGFSFIAPIISFIYDLLI